MLLNYVLFWLQEHLEEKKWKQLAQLLDKADQMGMTRRQRLAVLRRRRDHAVNSGLAPEGLPAHINPMDLDAVEDWQKANEVTVHA